MTSIDRNSDPWIIGIVGFGTRLDVDLNKLATTLTAQKDVFRFELITDRVELGKFDLAHCFSNEYYFERLDRYQVDHTLHGVVGITCEVLEDSKFNAHDAERGYGLVTIDRAFEYKPSHKTLEQYIAFLLLCEACCLVSKRHLEHMRRDFDLFDECVRKEDLTKCLSEAHINRHSRQLLRDHDFPENAGERILDFVRKTKVREWLLLRFQEPLPALFGGLFVGLSIEWLPIESPVVRGIVLAGAALSLICSLMPWRALRPRRTHGHV